MTAAPERGCNPGALVATVKPCSAAVGMCSEQGSERPDEDPATTLLLTETSEVGVASTAASAAARRLQHSNIR